MVLQIKKIPERDACKLTNLQLNYGTKPVGLPDLVSCANHVKERRRSCMLDFSPTDDGRRGSYRRQNYGHGRELRLVQGIEASTMAARQQKKKNIILLYERFSKLEAPHMVVLVYLTQGVGTYIQGEKLFTSTSISNMVLIDVAISIFTNRPDYLFKSTSK